MVGRAARGTAESTCRARRPRAQEAVDLTNPLLQRDDLGGLLVDDVLSETVLPVHLEHEPSEVAYPLLVMPQERAPLTA